MMDKLIDQDVMTVSYTEGLMCFRKHGLGGGQLLVAHHCIGTKEDKTRMAVFVLSRIQELGLGPSVLHYTPECEVIGHLLGEVVPVVRLSSLDVVVTKVERDGNLMIFTYVSKCRQYRVITRSGAFHGKVQIVNILEVDYEEVYEA